MARSRLIEDLSEMVAEQHEYRELLIRMTARDLLVRYKQAVMGFGWAVFMPLVNTVLFTVIFTRVAHVETDVPYPIFAYTGLMFWNFFASSLRFCVVSLSSNATLVTKVYFPREILPITYVAAALFDFLVASTLLAALMIYYRVPLTINALYVVPIIAVLSCFALAMSFLFSATQVRFRDIGVAVPLLLQVWLFATPVIYPLSAVPERIRPFYTLNPMVGIIDSFRRVILNGTAPETTALLISAVIAVILLVASYLYFKWVEATMADFA